MTRQSRLQEYKRMVGPKGESTQKNIDYWANRASENSQLPPRATKGDGAKAFGTSNGIAPKEHSGNMRAKAKADTNDAGTGYMPGIRREA
jgi:hypothetical protein